jgi:hypothetical protein
MNELRVAPSHYDFVYYAGGGTSNIICHTVLEYTLLPLPWFCVICSHVGSH